MAKILVFGDSVAWGAFDFEKGGWVERLKVDYLNQIENGESKYYVYNLGISSDDTKGTLFRLKTQIEIIEKIEPDDYIFIFYLGENDSRYIKEPDKKVVSIEDYEKNLQEIIKISREYSNKIFFVGLGNVDETKTKPYLVESKDYYENKYLREYDNKLKEICEKEKVDFINMVGLLEEGDLFDGLHPNEKGHDKIYKKIKNYLDNNLK